MNCRVFLVCKMAYHVSFEAIETHLHKNIYPSHVMGDKDKKASFRKASKPFSTLHLQLMYSNTGLVISSTERQHTIGSKVRKGLGHDSKAKAMASYCRRVQRYKRFQIDFSGIISKAMSKNLLINATNVRSREN